MKKSIYLLGSTGSIGETTLKILYKDRKKFTIKLLTTYSNSKKIYKQALKFNVREIVIFNKEEYIKSYSKFKKKKLKYSIQLMRYLN